MKKYCVLITIIFVSCLLGCDTYEMFDHYPGSKSSMWYCEEIDFKLEYALNAHGDQILQMSQLQWNDVCYTVYIGFHTGYYVMYSYKDEGPYEKSDMLLCGEWHYEGDNLVFEITEDNIFDNTFEKLVFVPIDQK